MTPSICSCSWQTLASLIVTTTASSQQKSGENRCHAWMQMLHILKYVCIRASLEHKDFQTCFDIFEIRYERSCRVCLRFKQECCHTEFMTSASSGRQPYNMSSTLEDTTAMVLDSSPRSVNKVGRIWFNEILNSLHVFFNRSRNPLPAFVEPWTRTREAKITLLATPSSRMPSTGIRYSKIRSLSCP